ncbi:FIG00676237: hypothetical protein [hydrothermal vent metagenome]|uniref:Outer membrane protein beta-barrel domain-containing protein n=1 Tax=hydrothermal vent metagenome TaxID=652676 RepID=A0A3B0ZAR6_9ZZZZ
MKYKIGWVVLFFFYSTGLTLASEKIDQIENLSQDEFKRLSENIGAAVSYKAVIPVEPLGITGFDVGIAVTGTEFNEDDLWQRATSSGSAPSTLYVPRLYAHKGLPFGIDIGAFYSELPDADLTLWGAEVRYAIWEGGVAAPALGIRATTTQLSGLSQFEISTLGVDIGISKGFTLLTVYGGAGVQRVESEVNLSSFNSEDFFQKRLYAGLSISLLLINLGVEYDITGDVNSLSVKAGLRF